MKPSIKIALSLFLALSTITFIIVWDLKISPNIDSEEVLVVPPNQKLLPNQTIQGDEFIVESRSKSSLIDDPLLPDELNSVVGYRLSDLLVGNQMVSKSHIDFDRILPDPDKGEAIRPIPDQWIYSQPGSLRRKDRINIYLFEESQINIVQKEEGSEDDDIDTTPALDERDDFDQLTKNLEDKELIETGSKPLLKRIPVVYAKDGSNNEVIDSSENQSRDRLNATGQISELELNLKEEDFNLLIGYIKQGYTMYITYQ